MARKKTKQTHPTPFSERISDLRHSAQLTMTQVAELINVTSSYISLLEAGERHPSREIVLKLGAIFFQKEDTMAFDELLILAGLSPTQNRPNTRSTVTRNHYEQGLKENPNDFNLYAEMLRAMIRNHWTKEVEKKIYTGMKHFHMPHQLQTLMANLQLSLGNFSAATASLAPILLDINNSEVFSKELQHEKASLFASMGLIYFLWEENECKYNKTPKNKEYTEVGRHYLTQSCEYFAQAIQINPQNDYLYYEYALSLEKQADLELTKENTEYREKYLNCLTQLILSEGFQSLETYVIKDASLDLAYAHSKSGDFAEGQKLLGLLQAAYPNYWRVYYIKALHHLLLTFHETKASEENFKTGLTALKKALSFQHASSEIHTLIPKDPLFKRLNPKQKNSMETLLSTAPKYS